MRMRTTILTVAAAAAIALIAGCGAIDDFPVDDGPVSGTICYSDSDCVPADCCGESSQAVHRDDRGDCSTAMCDGSCDPTMVDCGCGIPYCRDSHCAVATAESCL